MDVGNVIKLDKYNLTIVVNKLFNDKQTTKQDFVNILNFLMMF
jgi:hypothetical protein